MDTTTATILVASTLGGALGFISGRIIGIYWLYRHHMDGPAIGTIFGSVFAVLATLIVVGTNKLSLGYALLAALAVGLWPLWAAIVIGILTATCNAICSQIDRILGHGQ